ncbi:nodulation protein NfeD [Dehalobacterium formicoaceticum]|uniref:Nodulation protein NfeD n=2 Tax=Dehalobacterium formicoaceticum TaxID=51515 RepID=A0ABT1Y239_9FIRM|nr:NfeD family protein [Dehalobacterium formicoaceticum]MCR6544937.1 nodulation protein NfeD [Dehalobacterium formicoaceticum]
MCKLRTQWFWILLILLILSVPALAQPGDVVYIIPIEGNIDPALASFVERIYDEAEEADAARVILEIDTYGGYIDAAILINERALRSSVPTTSFVTKKAISAGALITLSGEKIFMAPGTTIGAAEPRLGDQKADEKVVSMWSQKLRAAAETYGRDGNIAAAMADADIEIEGLKAKGKLLTLTQQQALELKMADFSAANRQEVLNLSNLSDSRVVVAEAISAENLARWVTNPYISPILLTIGFAGIILELLTVGWGVSGLLGLTSLGLYFGGHFIAGFTGWESILLFIIGIILMLVEIFVVPGFGIAGVAGLGAMIFSIILTATSLEQAIISLIIALLGTVVLVVISFKYMRTRRLWNRLILGTRQEKSEGYVAPEENLSELLGAQGISLTPLRPSGTAEINGKRIDVVTEGGFIPRDTEVQVVQVEGTRVVVRMSR